MALAMELEQRARGKTLEGVETPCAERV